MSAIQELLVDLRRLQGVVGAAVVTPDGMMAASDLDDRFDDDAIAGLISFLTSTTNRALVEMSSSGLSRFTMHTTHGKVIVDDADNSYLVVITDQFLDLATVVHEVDDATRRLRRLWRISV
ncbi:MAG: roadblock/LC7 domain-containing protein [Phycisphaerales bacterium]|nr:roadblock/LC7 domain-containing protein [Phycisphaerales bacterium]